MAGGATTGGSGVAGGDAGLRCAVAGLRCAVTASGPNGGPRPRRRAAAVLPCAVGAGTAAALRCSTGSTRPGEADGPAAAVVPVPGGPGISSDTRSATRPTVNGEGCTPSVGTAAGSGRTPTSAPPVSAAEAAGCAAPAAGGAGTAAGGGSCAAGFDSSPGATGASGAAGAAGAAPGVEGVGSAPLVRCTTGSIRAGQPAVSTAGAMARRSGPETSADPSACPSPGWPAGDGTPIPTVGACPAASPPARPESGAAGCVAANESVFAAAGSGSVSVPCPAVPAGPASTGSSRTGMTTSGARVIGVVPAADRCTGGAGSARGTGPTRGVGTGFAESGAMADDFPRGPSSGTGTGTTAAAGTGTAAATGAATGPDAGAGDSRPAQGVTAAIIRCTTLPRAGPRGGGVANCSGGPGGLVAGGAAGSISRCSTPDGASGETRWPSGARNDGLRHDTSESPKSACGDTGRIGSTLRWIGGSAGHSGRRAGTGTGAAGSAADRSPGRSAGCLRCHGHMSRFTGSG